MQLTRKIPRVTQSWKDPVINLLSRPMAKSVSVVQSQVSASVARLVSFPFSKPKLRPRPSEDLAIGRERRAFDSDTDHEEDDVNQTCPSKTDLCYMVSIAITSVEQEDLHDSKRNQQREHRRKRRWRPCQVYFSDGRIVQPVVFTSTDSISNVSENVLMQHAQNMLCPL
jgi:hypothetical protein